MNLTEHMPPKKRTKYLLIVESPSKCSKIESYLGESYQCISSKGHIREIDGLSAINVNDRFQIQYKWIDEKKSHIETMIKIVSSYLPENVFLATDADREGEAIAWHICQVCSLNVFTTKRIVFREITQPALLHAVQNPSIMNLSLVAAQQARQVLDLIVGYKISPLLWRYLGGNKKNALSAGRCQTPALQLVVDHNKQYKDSFIHNISLVNQITGIFTTHMLPFQLTRTFSSVALNNSTSVLSDECKEFFALSHEFKHYLSVGESRRSLKSSPKPFNTSRLLQVASNSLKLSPKLTMSLCQTLYQMGLITYMRIDCQKYSEVFIQKAFEYIEKEFSAAYTCEPDDIIIKDISFPHEAIRVTNLQLKHFTNENSKLTKLYGLIWRNTVESCMSAATYNLTDVFVSAPLKSQYKYSIEVPVFLGWKRLEIHDSKEIVKEQAENSALVLYLKSIESAGNPVSWSLIKSIMHLDVQLPSHYTEASLIKKLEDMGIGRPSTFSSIVETIQDRGYVKKSNVSGLTILCDEFEIRPNHETSGTVLERTFGQETNKLVVQPTGLLVSEFLQTHFEDCFSYGYTKTMEDELDIITSLTGEVAMDTWHEICRRCHDEIIERLKPLVKQTKQTFALADSAEYVLQFNTYGPSLKRSLEDGTAEYCKVRTDAEIDLDKARRGEYLFSELVLREEDNKLGMYKGHPIQLKKGKYGYYVEWNEKTYSVKSALVQFDDAVELIVKKEKESHKLSEEDATKMFLPVSNNITNKSAIRILRTDLSIRKGKYGEYVYHKNSKMDNPKFYPLNAIKDKWKQMTDIELITWISNTHHVE
jgi:DNA topoisomerase-1